MRGCGTPGGLTAIVALWLGFAAAACGGDRGPPPEAPHAGADAQVKSVAKRWGDTVEESGFLQNDPNGVLHFRVITSRKVTLGDGSSVSVHVDRKETFETKLGPFHCTAKGDLTGKASYAWRSGEPEVTLELAGGRLPRKCEEPGFPVTIKAVDAARSVLLLRSDRLIGKTNARDSTVLLPLE